MSDVIVLYDGNCRFCRRTIRQLERERTLTPIRMLAQQSAEAQRRFPHLATTGVPENLIAIDASGGVHRAERAWVVIFGALRRYRFLSRIIAWRAVRPLAALGVAIVARNRFRISRWLPLDEVDRAGGGAGACGCGVGGCGAGGVEGSGR